jgi:hypothetical protein
MTGLKRRLELLERHSGGRLQQAINREILARLTDEDLRTLEEALLRPTLSPGEPLPPNPFIEEMKRWEAETIEQQRRR